MTPARSATRLGAGALAMTLVLGALGACSLLLPDDSTRSELEDARARWARVGPASYQATETRSCFCAVEALGPVVIRVTPAGVTRTYASDGRPVPAASAPFFPTVAGLFDAIEEALDQGAAQVTARYDPSTGAPLEVYIDRDERVADEEVGWTLTPPEPI